MRAPWRARRGCLICTGLRDYEPRVLLLHYTATPESCVPMALARHRLIRVLVLLTSSQPRARLEVQRREELEILRANATRERPSLAGALTSCRQRALCRAADDLSVGARREPVNQILTP